MLFRHCLVLLLFFSASLYASEPSGKGESPMHTYQFNLNHVKDHKAPAHGLIEYMANGEVLFSEKYVIETDGMIDNKVLLPDVTALGVAYDKSDFTVHVYVNDTLVDQYSMAQLAAVKGPVDNTDAEKRFCIPTPDDDCDDFDPCDILQLPDCDGDGVPTNVDNCPSDYNPNQADCDNDGRGNVCDGQNGIFQQQGGEKTCEIDKDRHTFDFDLEHYVEKRLVDVSACGSPDRYIKRRALKRSCSTGTDTKFCCFSKLSNSILSFGDSPTYWCNRIDQRLCH